MLILFAYCYFALLFNAFLMLHTIQLHQKKSANPSTVNFLKHKVKMLQVGYAHQVYNHQGIDLSHRRNSLLT